MIARRYVISGLVQRVGFRFFTVSRARRRGVQGWVRNLPDGRVEVLAVGEPPVLREFKAELEAGPRGASVEEVVEQEESVPAGQDGFEVRF